MGNVNFFHSLRTNEISRIFKPFVYIYVVLLVNFPEQSELSFYLRCSRSYKSHNLSDQSFETDFSSKSVGTEEISVEIVESLAKIMTAVKRQCFRQQT